MNSFIIAEAMEGCEGGIMVKKKRAACLICGKPSAKKICEACAERLQGEALEKKKKEENPQA
jgi:hypothetical protein